MKPWNEKLGEYVMVMDQPTHMSQYEVYVYKEVKDKEHNPS